MSEAIKRQLPRYHEVDFFDRFPRSQSPTKGQGTMRDTSPGGTGRKPAYKTTADQNELLKDKLSILRTHYGKIMADFSLSKINYSFSFRALRKEELLAQIIDILEMRTKLQHQSRSKHQGKGMHHSSYFDFCQFNLEYFKHIHPQQMKREKTIFNFLWSLACYERDNELIHFYSDLLKGNLNYKDLLNLLMVKDFVKFHIRKTGNYTKADLSEHGTKFQHVDNLIDLVRLIVLNYDEKFRLFYEEKFIRLRGDESEYTTLYDFVGLAGRCFAELDMEGVQPEQKKISVYQPTRPTKYFEDGGNHIDNHLLRHQGVIPTGHAQDRSKSARTTKADPKWFMWSDYTNNPDPRDVRRLKELQAKDISDFFSVELDEKVRKIQELSARKRGQKTWSPVPYKNLSDKSRRVVDKLEVKMKRDEDPEDHLLYTSVREDFDRSPGKIGINPRLTQTDRYDGGFESRQDEMDIFGVFDKLRDVNNPVGDRSIMQRVKDDEKRQAEGRIKQQEFYQDPGQLMEARKLQTIHQLLEDDLSQKVEK